MQDLERLLKEHGIETETTTTQQPSRKVSIGLVKEQVSRDLGDDGDDPRDLSLDHLVSCSIQTIFRGGMSRLTSRSSGKMETSTYMGRLRLSVIWANTLEAKQVGSTSTQYPSLEAHPNLGIQDSFHQSSNCQRPNMINAWTASSGTTPAGVSLERPHIQIIANDRYAIERLAIQT